MGTKNIRELKKAGYRFEFTNYTSDYIQVCFPIKKTFFNNHLLAFQQPAYIQEQLDTSICIDGKIIEGNQKYSSKITAKGGICHLEVEAYEQINEKLPLNGDTQINMQGNKPDGAIFKEIKGVSYDQLRHFSITGDLRTDLEKKFRLTKFVSRMDLTNSEVDCGESIKGSLQYSVIDKKKELSLLIEDICISNDPVDITIGGTTYRVDAEVCRTIEGEFSKYNIPAKQSQKTTKCDSIWWMPPSNWIDCNFLNQYNMVNNALYMWIGEDKTKKKYIQIGYVKGTPLPDKIQADQNQYSNIMIKEVRYSELNWNKCGKNAQQSVNWILESVAEQVHIHISAVKELFPKLGNDDWVVLPYGGNATYVNKNQVQTNILPKNLPSRDDNFYQIIESILSLIHSNSSQQQNNNGNVWNNPVEWSSKQATNEQAVSAIAAKSVYFAVYMWVGHNISKPTMKYIYVGIVGVDRITATNDNSVWCRIFEQEAKDKIRKKYEVKIDDYRYVPFDLSNQTVTSTWRSELLHTVETQTINAISALFPTLGGQITQKFEQVNGTDSILCLNTETSRHQN